MSWFNLKEKSKTDMESEMVPSFGYELIREILLPELLGKDTAEILYWAGKRIARKYPLETFEQIVEFFLTAGWGTLSVKKENKHMIELELQSSLISARLKESNASSFQLEAGFLAQQFELQKQLVSETFEHPNKKAGIVVFTIKWDNKDSISTTQE